MTLFEIIAEKARLTFLTSVQKHKWCNMSVWSLWSSKMNVWFFLVLGYGCSIFFLDWHLWKVNRYKTWWKSWQYQGPILIAYLLYCLFSIEISLNMKQEMLQYLSGLGQRFRNFQPFLTYEKRKRCYFFLANCLPALWCHFLTSYFSLVWSSIPGMPLSWLFFNFIHQHFKRFTRALKTWICHSS